jgi:hypothetical protein
VGYKVAVNGQSTGPFSLEQLAGKIQAKEVLPQTLVWKPGLTQWVPAQNVEDLAKVFALLPAEQVPVAAEPQQWEELPTTAAQPQSASQTPIATAVTMEAPEELRSALATPSIYSPLPVEVTPEETTEIVEQNSPPDSETPSSLLQESFDDGLPKKKLIVPCVLVLVGAVLTFLTLKTALFAAPLAKLAALFAKQPVEGEQLEELLAEGEAVAEGAAQAVPLLFKFIPGGLFVLAGIVVLVVTVLNRRSSEQFDPMQL